MELGNQFKTLQDVYGAWNPTSYIKGAELIGLQNQFNEQNLKQKQLETSQTEAMNPLRQQQLQIANDQGLAQLPGMQATSEMTQRKNANEGLFNDDFIKETMASYKGKLNKQEVDDIDNAGTAFMQLAETTWANPLGSNLRARDQFKKLGMEQYWNPKWDNLPADRLAMELSNLGKGLKSASPKLYAALETNAAKNEANIQRDALKAANAAELVRLRGSITAAGKSAAGGKDPKKLEELYTGVLAEARRAQATGDTETAAALYEEANGLIALKSDMDVRNRQAGALGKVDAAAATGLQSIPVPAAPQLPLKSPSIVNNPAVADPRLKQLPQGTKALGNGIYQLPDGRKVKAN